MATTKKKGSARSGKAKKAGAKDLTARGKVKGGFNPQPEPPRYKGGFDPQPDPPKVKGIIAVRGN